MPQLLQLKNAFRYTSRSFNKMYPLINRTFADSGVFYFGQVAISGIFMSFCNAFISFEMQTSVSGLIWLFFMVWRVSAFEWIGGSCRIHCSTYICLFVGPFSREFPKAQVWVAPRQWSWPLNLPLEFFGIFSAKVLRDDKDKSAPWADEIDQKILSSPEVGDNNNYLILF